jgi:hypothetical protein
LVSNNSPGINKLVVDGIHISVLTRLNLAKLQATAATLLQRILRKGVVGQEEEDSCRGETTPIVVVKYIFCTAYWFSVTICECLDAIYTAFNQI